MTKYFITGIGTEVGKTVVAAVCAQALHSCYWKPVQAGDLDNTDSMKVSDLTDTVEVLPEAFRLNAAMSPHAAAKIDGVSISVAECSLPDTAERGLIVEGAGGVLVPLNDHETMLDLMVALNIPVIVVVRNYLGSINHSLLTLAAIKARNLEVKGVIFNGEANPESESIILKHTSATSLGRVPAVDTITGMFVKELALEIKDCL